LLLLPVWSPPDCGPDEIDCEEGGLPELFDEEDDIPEEPEL
jgi:hypothetical protein